MMFKLSVGLKKIDIEANTETQLASALLDALARATVTTWFSSNTRGVKCTPHSHVPEATLFVQHHDKTWLQVRVRVSAETIFRDMPKIWSAVRSAIEHANMLDGFLTACSQPGGILTEPRQLLRLVK